MSPPHLKPTGKLPNLNLNDAASMDSVGASSAHSGRKGGFHCSLAACPAGPPIRVGVLSSLTQSEHLALAYEYDSIPTEVAACRIEAIQASAASGVRSPEAVARSSHHQASVGLVRRPSPFVRSMEPPWCGNPYCTAYGR